MVLVQVIMFLGNRLTNAGRTGEMVLIDISQLPPEKCIQLTMKLKHYEPPERLEEVNQHQIRPYW